MPSHTGLCLQAVCRKRNPPLSCLLTICGHNKRSVTNMLSPLFLPATKILWSTILDKNSFRSRNYSGKSDSSSPSLNSRRKRSQERNKQNKYNTLIRVPEENAKVMTSHRRPVKDSWLVPRGTFFKASGAERQKDQEASGLWRAGEDWLDHREQQHLPVLVDRGQQQEGHCMWGVDKERWTKKRGGRWPNFPAPSGNSEGRGFLFQDTKESVKCFGAEQPESVFKGFGLQHAAGTRTWVEQGPWSSGSIVQEGQRKGRREEAFVPAGGEKMIAMIF